MALAESIAAAEGDDGIEIAPANPFRRRREWSSGRFGQASAKRTLAMPGLFQLTGDARDIAELDHHAVGDDQRRLQPSSATRGRVARWRQRRLHQARQDDAVAQSILRGGPPEAWRLLF